MKCTNVIGAPTFVAMCDGQDEKAGRAAQARAGGGREGRRGSGPGWTELRGLAKPQLSVSGIPFLCMLAAS